jgi:hypothetical protein
MSGGLELVGDQLLLMKLSKIQGAVEACHANLIAQRNRTHLALRKKYFSTVDAFGFKVPMEQVPNYRAAIEAEKSTRRYGQHGRHDSSVVAGADLGADIGGGGGGGGEDAAADVAAAPEPTHVQRSTHTKTAETNTAGISGGSSKKKKPRKKQRSNGTNSSRPTPTPTTTRRSSSNSTTHSPTAKDDWLTNAPPPKLKPQSHLPPPQQLAVDEELVHGFTANIWATSVEYAARPELWAACQRICAAQLSPNALDYDVLVARSEEHVSEMEKDQVDKDVPRTFLAHTGFATEADQEGSLLPGLQRILLACLAREESQGYWQGMAFVAGFALLLYPTDERQAFMTTTFMFDWVLSSVRCCFWGCRMFWFPLCVLAREEGGDPFEWNMLTPPPLPPLSL